MQKTICAAIRQKLIKKGDIECVNVETTVQKKAVAFPTDSGLYQKARLVMVREGRKRKGLTRSDRKWLKRRSAIELLPRRE